jgi:hypothetical protein
MDKVRNPDGTINAQVLAQLRAEDPAAFLKYQELELNDAKMDKLRSEAEENRAVPSVTMAKPKMADYTVPSWANYVATGDSTYLRPDRNKENADIKAEYARIRNEYGEKEANDFITAVNGGQPNQYRVQAKPAIQDANYNYTDANGVTRTPIIHDTTQPQKVINEMRTLKPKVDKAFKSNQLLLRGARNGIRRLLATGDLGKITGVVGAFPNMWGSDAADADSLLKGIKEKEFLNNYQRIKAAGGGFGSLTEKEGERLEDMRAVLNKAQSPEQFKDTLIMLEKELAKYEELDRVEYYQTYGDKEKFGLNSLIDYESSTPNVDKLGASGGSGIPSDAEVDSILGL